jgi:ribosomal protein S12 methylthiotransferase accessory factor
VIDGEFLQQLAVTPRELLATLERGHRVVGAASMGALRAAELWPFGMRGVGRVFDAYRQGQVERDDEVAVVFDPDTHRAATEALIGMRLAFREAEAAGLIDADECAFLTDVAQATHFTHRTYAGVVRALATGDERAHHLVAFLTDRATDLKAADATEALRQIADGKHEIAETTITRPTRLATRARRVLGLATLPRAVKCPGFTSVRTREAHETDAILREFGPHLGITRVADITQLDTLGIPCFTAVRPGLGPSAYSGKALSPVDARVGAQMEAIETAAAFSQPPAVCRGDYRDAIRHGDALDPDVLPVCNTAPTAPREFVDDWVVGSDLRTGKSVLVPAAVVYLGLTATPPWYVSSNGLASGNSITEAIAHGLAEVIERDALCLHSLAMAGEPTRALLRVLAEPPPGPRPARVPGVRASADYSNVDLTTLPEPFRDVCRAVEATGARIVLRHITSDIQVPTFACLIHEELGAWGELRHIGSGAHPDARVAVRRAITEAAQCRATYIQGVREDLPEPALAASFPVGGFWAANPEVAFGEIADYQFDDVFDDVVFMLERLADAGLDRVVAVDLGDSDWPVSVAKVIVCGAEPPLAFDGINGPWLGWRARSALGLLS